MRLELMWRSRISWEVMNPFCVRPWMRRYPAHSSWAKSTALLPDQDNLERSEGRQGITKALLNWPSDTRVWRTLALELR